HRADIVEHAAGDRGRSGDGQEHCQDAAAGGADECRPADTERREHGKHVGELDLQIVICRRAVVVGFAATAIVEGKDSPRSLASATASSSKSAVVRARPGRQITGRARFVRAPRMRTCNLRPSCALTNRLWPAAGAPSWARSLALCGIGAQPKTWSVGPYEGW